MPTHLHPDRLLPADPGVRALARRLYETVRDLPILSPHGHVDARLLVEDEPFGDPAGLLISPDHYVTRLLHAAGVPRRRRGWRGGGCASTGRCSGGRRSATGWTRSWARSSASRSVPGPAPPT
ncbi:glucuronate isomerase [Actinomadura sp. 7K507]|uniref:glucuronate isomerase n=1 Tax=Actinomadura sp. 7K507 TaxID=2530365 RepID=UPI0024426ADF|nr:glucuronate isomerase [Actinomadura sp. 7K507]